MINELKKRFGELRILEPDWGGNEEPAPIQDSLDVAELFLDVLEGWKVPLPFKACLDHEGYAQLAYLTESEGDYFVMTFYAPDVCWYCFRPKGQVSEIKDVKLSVPGDLQEIKDMIYRLCF